MDLLTPKMWTPFTMKMVFASVLLICSFEKKVLMRHRWAESPSSLQLPARMDDPQGTWSGFVIFPQVRPTKKHLLTHISWGIKNKKCGKNITPGPTARSAPQRRTVIYQSKVNPVITLRILCFQVVRFRKKFGWKSDITLGQFNAQRAIFELKKTQIYILSEKIFGVYLIQHDP